MAIANLTHSLQDVANHFKVAAIDVSRWAALGFIQVDVVDGQQVVLHDNLVRAIPKLSTVPMGIKRDRSWFDSAHVPNAKTRYHVAVKGAAEDQMLSKGEVEARSNSRTKGMEIALVFSKEIRDAIGSPWKSGMLQRVEDSIGKNSDFWQPSTIMTGYIAESLIKLIERKTASSLSNLYASKSEFQTLVTEAITEFMNADYSFNDVVQASNLNVTVVYSLANRSAFTQEQVDRVSRWIL